jgi:CRISPR-associated protein (TIGR03984 family)
MKPPEPSLDAWRATQPLALEHALACCAEVWPDPWTVALYYTPRTCGLALWLPPGGTLSLHTGALDLDPVFELRAFSAHAELRWVHEAAGLGRGVLLRVDGGPEPAGWIPLQRPQCLRGPRRHTYLLWGQVAEGGEAPGADGPRWVRLQEARIGSLSVPLAAAAPVGARVVLRAEEFWAQVDDHGNVAVVEERLCGLEVVSRGDH